MIFKHHSSLLSLSSPQTNYENYDAKRFIIEVRLENIYLNLEEKCKLNKGIFKKQINKNK